MKILVTGKHGYIANSFVAYMKKNHPNYSVDLISLRDDAWRDISFAAYDAVLHTAGLAHMRETRRNQYDYFIINRDLALEVAHKAKADGVRQFIFMSSLSVYGMTHGHIAADTPTAPTTNYGRSKLAAEALLAPLADDTFTVAILRASMVYGPDCPGNYAKLCRLVRWASFFPDYENARDMVHVTHLCAHIAGVVKHRNGGLLFPRDPKPTSTRGLAEDIAKMQGKRLRFTKIFNIPIACAIPYVGMISKLFGSLTIDASLPLSATAFDHSVKTRKVTQILNA
ncbi:MAG: NAD-dependent epimerase/dehydratase family protein [Defluviitaleaceae bacterium]|nr:NAD-dependent epimerase/dehydratase family protein [Defluviitaleaceae bacterium]